MNSIRIRIALKDKEYAAALAKALCRRHSGFLIRLEDSPDPAGEAEDWDVLLAEEDQGQACQSCSEDKLVLCEDWPPDSKEGFVYKYSGVSEIASRILILHGVRNGRGSQLQAASGTKFIGVTAACGGVGKTVTAIALARELASCRKSRVLYLSLEEMESTGMYFQSDMGKSGLGDYLYYLFSDRKDMQLPDIRAFFLTDHHGVDAFRPSKGQNELRELSPEELAVFLENVAQSGRHDYLVLDFAGHPQSVTRLLFSICKKILLVDDSGSLAIHRNEKLLRYLKSLPAENLGGKVIPVHNKWTESSGISGDAEDVFLEADPGSFRTMGSMIEIDSHRRFGMGVRKLAEKLCRKA